MNKIEKSKSKSFFTQKGKDLLLIGVLAILLFFVAWKIFQGDDAENNTSDLQLTESEYQVMRILREIDGVGEASVVVRETEEEVQSVVVICEGANDLRVVMNIREAVSAALNTQQKVIKIYLKKE